MVARGRAEEGQSLGVCKTGGVFRRIPLGTTWTKKQEQQKKKQAMKHSFYEVHQTPIHLDTGKRGQKLTRLSQKKE